MAVPIYQFGPYRLEVSERRLLRSGVAIPLRTKVFDTLCVLVENAGRLLTKEELMQAIWPDAVVEENNLNHNISALRRALGDKATGESFIETVPRVGYRFVAEVQEAGPAHHTLLPAPAAPPGHSLRQEIRFCTAGDGVRLAYSAVGAGPPIIKSANWLNHLEFEWESPVWKHWIAALTRHHTLIRYDERGVGLSDWSVEDISFPAFVRDLESIVEANSPPRFTLLGISQGAAVACAYAARHPERVERLILYGGYTHGWAHRGPDEVARRHASMTLIRHGWGRDNPAFRQMFTTMYMPEATLEQSQFFNELQRRSASPENAARLMQALGEIDVRPIVGQVKAPTIVFHCEHDAAVPFSEGRSLAAAIPGARLVPLPSRNHLLLEHEPAWPIFLDELGRFLGWSASAGA
jgi:DNA-binding winged helix-turn-helix (wHTH) protein/pimeloyl-ACP methyl ester carboxylesterase